MVYLHSDLIVGYNQVLNLSVIAVHEANKIFLVECTYIYAVLVVKAVDEIGVFVNVAPRMFLATSPAIVIAP